MDAAGVVLILAWVGALLGPLAAAWLWRRRTRWAGALLAAGGVLYALGVWGFLIEPELFVVRHVTVTSAAWRGPPLRIGVVSDTHAGGPHVTPARVARIVAQLDRETPDVAVFLGDYAGGHVPADRRSARAREQVIAGVRALGAAKAPLGRYAVLGNHDWWYDGPTLETALRRNRTIVLENEAARVDRPGGAFWIAGLADMDSLRASPRADAALAEVRSGEPVVVLTHEPDAFAKVPPTVALTLAGHTHCGQVNLPLIGRPALPSPGSRRWPCGLYVEGGRALYVTGGIGTSILPVRIGARPEIAIVTLRAGH